MHSGSTALRFISLNVHTANDQFDLVKQLIRDHDPDVVLLMEVNAEWIEALEELHSVYPYQQVEPREDNFGIALYSKRAFTTCAPFTWAMRGCLLLWERSRSQGKGSPLSGHTLCLP